MGHRLLYGFQRHTSHSQTVQLKYTPYQRILGNVVFKLASPALLANNRSQDAWSGERCNLNVWCGCDQSQELLSVSLRHTQEVYT